MWKKSMQHAFPQRVFHINGTFSVKTGLLSVGNHVESVESYEIAHAGVHKKTAWKSGNTRAYVENLDTMLFP